tara:strand:- start:68482 stop:68841 length:360 start_codon:yes stop_codon:yes gene_type:complete
MLKNKIITGIVLIMGLVLCVGCSEKKKKNDIVVGGLYIMKSKDGSYRSAKILNIDNVYISVRFYSDIFKERPVDLNSKNLSFHVFYHNVVKESFLLYRPELFKIEKLSKEESEPFMPLE